MGLLDSIDNLLGTRLGLLANDPRAAIGQMNQQAGAFNQASLLAVQAERNAMNGRPSTPEQLAAKQMVDEYTRDLAMGFGGVLKGVPKENIKNIAEEFAKNINDAGFLAKVEHSGSKLGPSSYINVSDPVTGRYLQYPIRVSNHSKGPVQSQFVYDISNVSDDLNKTLEVLNQMRSQGPVLAIRQQKYAEDLINQGIKPKSAYKQAQREIKE